MTAKELDQKLDNLGYAAVSKLVGVELDEYGNMKDDPEKFELLYKNPIKLYDQMDKTIVDEIRQTYRKLQVLSVEEDYFFIGANYKTLVKCVLRDMSKYNDPLTGYEDEDYLKVIIGKLKHSIKNEIVHIRDLTPDYEFGWGCDYFLFLQLIPHIDAKRNIKKAIKILKQELLNIEINKKGNFKEIVTLDYSLSKIEKLGYLKESGVLSYLTKNNSPNTVAKLLMKLIDFDTDNVGTIERYIKICLNEPDHQQYPKNIDQINQYFQKVKFKKE
ncbi:hypothetical protein [Winogradskyella tangerina]|uniref:hypothetical protein n=1 Tax=Winogradskyella tangerina TaxID=2023240 RepID=UPI000DBE9BF2|nr:hypothetical protein [Winogradskyella tangerina]